MGARPIGIYVRVSSQGDRADERFHSPKEQRERAAGLVVARGLTPGPVFEDIDVSGAMEPSKRPGMGALLRAIDAGELGGVAAYSLDRLSREPAHGDALVRRITKAGGVILTPDIPDAIDTPTGEFTFGMLLQVAKLYRRQAGARFATAKERAIKEGIPLGPVPLGYRRGDEHPGRLEIDPETAPIVREVFERRAAGAGRVTLARLIGERTSKLSADHYHHKAHWSREAPMSIVANALYLTGRMTYGELVSEHAAGGIVDEPLWHAAQRPTNPDLRPPRGPGWLLSGILKCASCGYSMSPTSTNSGRKDQSKRRYYRCVNRRCNARASIRAEVAEEAVTREYFARHNPTVDTSGGQDIAPLEEALEVAERRLAQVMTDEASDALGDMWAPETKRRRLARDEAAEALGQARMDTPADVQERITLARHWSDEVGLGALETGGTGPVVFISMEVKRRLLTWAFGTVGVAPDKTLDFDYAVTP